jgi:lysine-N-methylase
MAKIPFTLPTVQNWSCHNCGGCCKQHAIYIREEDKQRILSQQWESDEHLGSVVKGDSSKLFHVDGGMFSKSWTRLSNQADGSCIFLNEKGLCRIHAKFGEDAKPLACRIYPYAFHPAGKTMTVSLRFSCPSVAANLGKNVSESKKDIEELIRLTTPANFRDSPAPALKRGVAVDWADALRVSELLEEAIGDDSVAFELSLARTLFWTGLLEQASYEKIKGPRVRELIELVAAASVEELPELPVQEEPSRISQTSFRLLAAQYSRKENFQQITMSYRWKLVKAALRFSAGKGETLPLHPDLKAVPFSAIEETFEPISTDDVELLRRLMRVKLKGMHFCGRPYYQTSVVEGYQALVLLVVSIMYIARWIAVGHGRRRISRDDLILAITIADHHHGYSPSLGSASAKQRVRTLATKGDLEKLVTRYVVTEQRFAEDVSTQCDSV